jgi:hypothetical protein
MQFKKSLNLLLILLFVLLWTEGSQAAFETLQESPARLSNPPENSYSLVTETLIRVPQDVANLQTAIDQVPDGGVIEIAAGTYTSPAGGFRINNTHKGFTIRAAPGASVILSGGSSRDILRFQNSSLSEGGPVLFKGLTFANGKSTTEGIAGGVTLYEAEATFVECIFRNNAGIVSTTVGGAVYVAENSIAFFFNSIWEDNTSRVGGAGLGIRSDSKVYIHRAQFIDNRANPANHHPTASGGGINVGNATLRVSETLFQGNRAGAFGGALYIIGVWTAPVTTPLSDVIVANSLFIDNHAVPDPSVSQEFPTEGGAINVENQTLLKIYNSRFIRNEAKIGGGVNMYRAVVKIYGSAFLGNRATDTQFQSGFGGAISANSADGPDDGTNNRPPSDLSIENTFFQGSYAAVTTVAQTGGCLFAGGDGNRIDGDPKVPDMGTVAENRASVVIKESVFYDCDVSVPTSNSGVGGAMELAIVNLTMEDSLVASSDAFGDYGSGGGLAIIYNSSANIQRTTIADNSADKFGGGLFVQGSHLELTDCNLIENTIQSADYGSAIFSAPDDGRNLPATGFLQGCTISSNHGLSIFDDDRNNGPINDMRYNNNAIFAGGVNVPVYSDSIPNYSWKTVAELNNLIITRQNNISTPKSQLDNAALGARPSLGAVIAAPTSLLQTTAAGSPVTQYPVYLAYAWSGGNATLDNQSISSTQAGVKETLGDGTHTLRVDGNPFTTQVSQAAKPSALFTVVSNGTTNTLHWSVEGGTFLESAIDQGVSITSAPTGSVQVPSTPAREYSFYAITEEGGIYEVVDTAFPELYAPASIEVLTGLNLPSHFGYINVANIGGGVLEWTAQSNAPDLIQIETPGGQTENIGTVIFSIDVKGRSPGLYNGEVEIDAGAGGNQTVAVNVHIVDFLERTFLPILNH